MRSRAVEALEEMRGHVDAALDFRAHDDEPAYRWELAKASRWSLVFLAESVASERGREIRGWIAEQNEADV